MKKYLLTALLGVFGLCTAFASADSVVYTDGTPSPSSIYYVGNVGVDGIPYLPVSISSSTDYASISIDRILLDGNIELASVQDNVLVSNGRISFFADNDDLINGNYDYLLLEFGQISDYQDINDVNYTLSSDNFYTSLPSEGGDSSGTILPNGTDDLKGIINGLKSTIAEFVPYIAYIGLGIIVACLGFVAIRRLVNWVRAKIFDNF